MSEENKVQDTTLEEALNKINEMKQNTVPKEAYDELKESNRKLLENIVNGATITDPAGPEEEPADIKKLANDLIYGHHSNQEYCRKALKIREEMLKQGYPDPFTPQGERAEKEDSDSATAQRVAEAIQASLEEAEGSDEAFTALLQIKLEDPPSVKAKLASRASSRR